MLLLLLYLLQQAVDILFLGLPDGVEFLLDLPIAVDLIAFLLHTAGRGVKFPSCHLLHRIQHLNLLL